MTRHARLTLAAAAVLSLCASSLALAESSQVAFGRRIAERNCGACHAVGAGVSPNPRSPPFRRLYRRYRASGLDGVLAEGMLAPEERPEEGDVRVHPRMPQAQLGDDEVAALKAYLHSLEPPRRHRR
ncbi:MAG: cytochrome c [Caulobacteraceae bacterium]|nr:cytochrome c [Caulobacteraceae bacterium]